jgi:hypothetical protein
MDSYDAFISHSSADKLTARLIRGYLRSHNIHSWFDESETILSDSVDDTDILARLNPAIDQSRYFLLLISRSAVASPWVEKEVRHAIALRAEGRDIKLVGVMIEPMQDDEKPEWMRAIRHLDVSGAFQMVDRLKELRDEIGSVKPTYIGDVEPNFFKQIPTSKLQEHMVKCAGNDISIWYINAGFTLQHYLIPAFEEMLASRPSATLRCRVMLLDSSRLTHAINPFLWPARAFQRRLDETIRKSKFLTNEAPHESSIRTAIVELERLRTRYTNFEYELKLTKRLPAGRLIFISGIGFFGPYVKEFNSKLPMLVFDRNSPFFLTAKQHFEEAYSDARVIAPERARAA